MSSNSSCALCLLLWLFFPLFVCIFIGNLISLLVPCDASSRFQNVAEQTRVWQDVYAKFVFLRIGNEMAWEQEEDEEKVGRKMWANLSNTNLYEKRVSRKKEINFHKFESQIKLRAAKNEKSRGSCAALKPYTRFASTPSVIFWLLWFACFNRNGKGERHFCVPWKLWKWKINYGA